jgi:hypothetical protein
MGMTRSNARAGRSRSRESPGVTLLLEPVCVGGEHVPVNSSMLRMVHAAFPDQRIVFAGEATHLEQVAEMSAALSASVEWHALQLPSRHGPPGWPRRRSEWRLWSEMLDLIRRHRPERLLLLSTPPDGLLDIKAWLWRAPRVKALAVLHSVLDGVMASRRSKWQWWAGPAPRLRWLVLGRHIVDAVEGEFRPIMPRLRWIPHPVLGLDSGAEPEPADGPGGGRDTTIFAFPGLATEGKGFGEFCAIAEVLKENPRARFELIGRLPPGTGSEGVGPVRVPELGDQRLGRREYEERIRRARYLLLPLRPDAYRFVASGSIMDAVVLRRPIIGFVNSPPTRELFDQFGDVGHLCDGLDSMVELVRGLAGRPDPTRYRRQLDNLAKARAALTPEALAGSLAKGFE